MILTCPSCSVRYLVDAQAIGRRGRMVRCARCSHTWHQEPSEEALAAAPPPASLDAPEPAQAARAARGDDEAAAAARRPGAPPLAAERRIQLPALRPKKRRWGLALAWAVAAIVVLAGLAYAAVAERDRVVALVPGAAALYARAGLAPEGVGAGLALRNIAESRDMENGLPTLVVSGEVTNVSSIPREVPKLVVILRDKTEHDLQNATVALDRHSLAPGETLPFHTSITQPAEAAAGVVVTFAGINPG